MIGSGPAIGMIAGMLWIRVVFVVLFGFAWAALAEEPAAVVAPDSTPAPVVAVHVDRSEVAAEYRIRPGDLIRMVVYDNPDLTTQFRVPVSGQVVLPLIGGVADVIQMPISELTAELHKEYADGFLRHPQLTVEVIEYAHTGVYVVGAVVRSGLVRLVPGQKLTVLQAIGEAGGWAPEANQAAAQVISDAATGLAAIQVGLNPDGKAFMNPLLSPGDVVIIPRADRVYVLGRVKEPGALVLPAQGQLTVSKAITMSGGLERFARDSEVQLLREGQPSVEVNVNAILAGQKSVEDPLLSPGDTVFVPERRF